MVCMWCLKDDKTEGWWGKDDSKEVLERRWVREKYDGVEVKKCRKK